MILQEVEYDMDEEDVEWLKLMNRRRNGNFTVSVPGGKMQIKIHGCNFAASQKGSSFPESDKIHGCLICKPQSACLL